MKTIALVLLMFIPQAASSKVVVPTWRPKPFVIVHEDGTFEFYWPPFIKTDGSVRL